MNNQIRIYQANKFPLGKNQFEWYQANWPKSEMTGSSKPRFTSKLFSEDIFINPCFITLSFIYLRSVSFKLTQSPALYFTRWRVR